MRGKRASLGEEAAGSWRVLPNPPLEAAGDVFQWERASSAQRTQRPEAEPSMAPALARLAQIFLASRANTPGRGGLRGVYQTCLGASPWLAPLGPFHWA